MGEVYRARDTRLGRDVAIKVLPAEVAQDAERRARFEREARAVSGLNHPHICMLHDIGQQDGIDYLVMELLEGQSLLERLDKGALPTDQVLRYGTQIAEALSQAHKHGVVHRDLKPANVMLAKSGVKVLDFGLAKTAAPGPLGSASELATGTRPLTRAGTLLGTFQYMAPEQLEGKEADARADIWALGCVLYEMATGQRAFAGKSHASLIAAILEHDPPPIAELRPMTPTALDRLVRKCLAKDPDDRWDTAHDLADELKWIADGASSATGAAVTTVPRNRSAFAGWIVAAVVGLAFLGFALIRARGPVADERTLRLQITAPPGVRLGTYLALSPDGRHLAFPGTDASGQTMIWLRALDTDGAVAMPGTEGGGLPFWSPDSRELAFFAGNKLKRVGLSGGTPQTICPAADGRGGSWSKAGEILFSADCCSGLSVVPAAGGTPTAATSLDPSGREQSHRWPQFLPDGRRFVYTVSGASARGAALGLYLSELGSTERRRIAESQSIVALRRDRLLYVKEGRLVSRRLVSGRLDVEPETPALDDPVRLDSDLYGLVSFTASAEGLVALRGGGRQQRLVWFDRAGRRLDSLGAPGAYSGMALSPDGRQLAAAINAAGAWDASLWLLDVASGRTSRLTFEDIDANQPSWSGDGTRVLFRGSKPDEVSGFFVKATSGGAIADLMHQAPVTMYPDDWSTDGRYVVFEPTDPKTQLDLWTLPLFGDRKPQSFLVTPANEAMAKLSPDGKWIAYSSDALGRVEVFVQPFPTGPGRWQVSTNGGYEPLWRRDGRELFYLSADQKLMSVVVRSQAGRFEADVPRALFSAPLASPPGITATPGRYAVSPDGQRFLINHAEETDSPITVVVNGLSALER
jgi:Tol biopolymer transport system component